MIEVIQNYKELKKNMGNLINKSGYKNSFLAEKIGMQPTLFSVKKQRGNWSDDEMEKILVLIENEELEDYYFGELLREKEKEETINYSEFKREMGWK
ncbi:hypothetical protein ACFP1I_15405 [Dyadobacter subterraneus]|uniref:XRE family transcriptional regulator n=1 Tax=Dyadobacter subterraneus TaxID=2773304 RepID=A0ABR9WCF3_9BACT|nr:hypothetical protein [Dyadobacter subterraneus]MBE9462849.1 hypothetical protein [Dyadobacter subterraneus]